MTDSTSYTAEAGAAASSQEDIPLTVSTTINCGPVGTSSSATCTTTFSDVDDSDYTGTPIETLYFTGIESSLYTVFFSTASGYSTTSATPSPTSSAPTATSTSSPKPSPTAPAHPSLGPSAKVGIALGVPLGACAVAGLALLLYRHGKHKERSRMSQMGNLAPPEGFASGSDGKRLSVAGAGG